MTGPRTSWMVVLALLGASGCTPAFNLRGNNPAPATTLKQISVHEFVASHNENADRIKTLQARPSIRVASTMVRGGVEGHLWLEKPQNFKLVLTHMGATKADLGSNDREFWFWVQNRQDRSIYWADHSDAEANGLAASYQPDWIIEALGIKSISPAEEARITAREGPEPGTTLFTFAGGSNPAYREVVVWNQSRRIKEYSLYSRDRKTLLARAEIKNYKTHELESNGEGLADTCHIPGAIRLEWKPEQLALDVDMDSGVKINQFDSTKSAGLFVEPKVPGYTRVNLSEMANMAAEKPETRSRTMVRRTIPPPVRRDVKLGRPSAIEDEASNQPAASRPLLEPVIGAPMPAPPGTDWQTASTVDRSGLSSSIDR